MNKVYKRFEDFSLYELVETVRLDKHTLDITEPMKRISELVDDNSYVEWVEGHNRGYEDVKIYRKCEDTQSDIKEYLIERCGYKEVEPSLYSCDNTIVYLSPTKVYVVYEEYEELVADISISPNVISVLEGYVY